MYAAELQYITTILAWDEKTNALSMLLKTHLQEVSSGRSVDLSLLDQAITIAIEGTSRRIEQSSTLGESLIVRANFADILETLVALMFFCAGASTSNTSLHLEAVLSASSSANWRLLERLGELLRHGSQWTLRLAKGSKVAQLYQALPLEERLEWQRHRTVFAEQMARSHFDPLFPRLLQDRNGVLRQALDRMCYFGTLAQLDRVGDREAVPALSLKISDRFGLVFHTKVTRAADTTSFGFLVLTAKNAVLWTSAAWSAWVNNYLQGDEQTQSILLSQMPTHALAKLIGGFDLSTICINDLSRGDIPLELALDPEAKLLTCVTPVATDHPQGIPCSPRFLFGGGFEYGRAPTIQVDEAERALHWSLGPAKIANLKYPEFPVAPLKVFGVPKPLLFSHYERWELAAIVNSSGASLKSLRARTSRQEFLDENWRAYDILHLVTHGEAFPEYTESSHLVLGNAHGLPECVTFADILALDWSHVSLVFLNCCVTAIGTQTHGDDRLSLAWAFLAGGARYVIGHRWRVQDEAAYLFAKKFYMTLLQENSSIRAAFQIARQWLKESVTCSDVSVWGTFVLLENPWM